MIFLMGVGSRRTSVGSARIWSPRPSAGILDQVDDFDAVTTRQMLVADLAQVGEGPHRLRRLAGDVQAQIVFLRAWSFALGAPCGLCARAGVRAVCSCLGSISMPRVVKRKLRTSSECGMPRDLST